jgi:hypothetical protein
VSSPALQPNSRVHRPRPNSLALTKNDEEPGGLGEGCSGNPIVKIKS